MSYFSYKPGVQTDRSSERALRPLGYGTTGITSATNTPGARYGAVSWIDNSENFWMFGGYGYVSTTFPDYSNDLWRYK